MSRSSKVLGGVLGAVVAALIAMPASAGPPGLPSAPSGAVLPVVAVAAPVLDLRFASSDVAGTATQEETDRGIRFRLDSTLLFARDSAELRPRARAELARVARKLRSQGRGRVLVVGYTDNLGSAAHGVTLSRRRAAAVARSLRSSAVLDGYLFQLRGLGEADPVASNKSETGRRRNRRVVVTFSRA